MKLGDATEWSMQLVQWLAFSRDVLSTQHARNRMSNSRVRIPFQNRRSRDDLTTRIVAEESPVTITGHCMGMNLAQIYDESCFVEFHEPSRCDPPTALYRAAIGPRGGERRGLVNLFLDWYITAAVQSATAQTGPRFQAVISLDPARPSPPPLLLPPQSINKHKRSRGKLRDVIWSVITVTPVFRCI